MLNVENMEYNTTRNQVKPNITLYLPQTASLIHWPAPNKTKNIPNAAMAGWRDGLGTK